MVILACSPGLLSDNSVDPSQELFQHHRQWTFPQKVSVVDPSQFYHWVGWWGWGGVGWGGGSAIDERLITPSTVQLFHLQQSLPLSGMVLLVLTRDWYVP
jgi:hypothetical protein